jgi:hypothetical protein
VLYLNRRTLASDIRIHWRCAIRLRMAPSICNKANIIQYKHNSQYFFEGKPIIDVSLNLFNRDVAEEPTFRTVEWRLDKILHVSWGLWDIKPLHRSNHTKISWAGYFKWSDTHIYWFWLAYWQWHASAHVVSFLSNNYFFLDDCITTESGIRILVLSQLFVL